MSVLDPDAETPAWVRTAVPPVPVELGPWLARAGGDDVRPGTEPLGDAAAAALDRALDSAGRDAAFHLLAADALLTWACEAALAAGAPEDALLALTRRVSAGPDGSPDPRG